MPIEATIYTTGYVVGKTTIKAPYFTTNLTSIMVSMLAYGWGSVIMNPGH